MYPSSGKQVSDWNFQINELQSLKFKHSLSLVELQQNMFFLETHELSVVVIILKDFRFPPTEDAVTIKHTMRTFLNAATVKLKFCQVFKFQIRFFSRISRLKLLTTFEILIFGNMLRRKQYKQPLRRESLRTKRRMSGRR